MYFSEWIKIFLLAMTPLGELRVAIPIGLVVYGLNPYLVYFLSVLGNLFSVFLILVFLGVFSKWASRNIYFFNRFFAWLFPKTRKNHGHRVGKYGLFLLPLLVAVPFPLTGGWTASLVAFVFGIPFKKAFPLIASGVLTAGLIVSFLTKAGIAIQKNFGWQMAAGILLIAGVIYLFYKKVKNNNIIRIRDSGSNLAP